MWTNNSVHKMWTNNSVHKMWTNNSVHKMWTNNSVHKMWTNNSVHLSCAHRHPEQQHDTYYTIQYSIVSTILHNIQTAKYSVLDT